MDVQVDGIDADNWTVLLVELLDSPDILPFIWEDFVLISDQNVRAASSKLSVVFRC
jgi:hypothetical protein